MLHAMPAPQDETGRVWDVPTRLSHWLLVAAFTAAWLSHDDDRYLDLHVYAGYLFLGLLTFRLLWGVTGTRYARFRAFVGPVRNAWAYVRDIFRRRAPRHLGHNPAGGWAVVAMIGLGLAVSVSGLVVLGGEERHGPLAGWFSFEQGAAFHRAHELAARAMLALLPVHVAGVVVGSVSHRENLVAAMITGRKRGAVPGVPSHAGLGVALVALVMISAGGYFVGYATATPERPYRPFVGPALPDNATWRAECGSCHLAFHPGLLPARSWDRLLARQADHFGDDLALDEQTQQELARFLRSNAAERTQTEVAWKINRSLAPTEAPLRVTEAPYWRRKHDGIPRRLWDAPPVNSKANCAACHFDAEAGTFEDAAMRLPPKPTF